LGIEIDVTSSSVPRVPIYAALGIPEVWRFNGEILRVYRRQPDGQYVVGDQSGHFPQIPVTELATFARRWAETDENSLVRSFRSWVRQQIGEEGQRPPATP